jgi:hypothetical protein
MATSSILPSGKHRLVLFGNDHGTAQLAATRKDESANIPATNGR